MRGGRILVVLMLMSGLVFAQPVTVSNQGAPGNQGSWVVFAPCVTVVETVTSVGSVAGGFNPVAVPTTAQTGRKVIVVCNSPENTGAPILKCRADGTNPVIGNSNAGQAMAKGDCFTYSTTTAVKCISDTSSIAASATECK